LEECKKVYRFFLDPSSTSAVYNGILDDETYKGIGSRNVLMAKPLFEDWLRPTAALTKGKEVFYLFFPDNPLL